MRMSQYINKVFYQTTQQNESMILRFQAADTIRNKQADTMVPTIFMVTVRAVAKTLLTFTLMRNRIKNTISGVNLMKELFGKTSSETIITAKKGQIIKKMTNIYDAKNKLFVKNTSITTISHRLVVMKISNFMTNITETMNPEKMNSGISVIKVSKTSIKKRKIKLFVSI